MATGPPEEITAKGTHHEPLRLGSRCVECQMPKTGENGVPLGQFPAAASSFPERSVDYPRPQDRFGPVGKRFFVPKRRGVGMGGKDHLVPPSRTSRLLSIDALRGFDMFWIMGADAAARAWARWSDWPIRDEVNEQLEHVPWEGFHFYDLIFPLFLFVVGLVIPFSLTKMQRQGDPAWRIYARIFRRTILLFVLGLLYWGDFSKPYVEDWRIVGVLQRIALGYCFASL